MNKRILIRRLAIPAAIIAALSIAVLLAFIPINNARFERHKEEFKKYSNAFMEQNTKYLKDLALKIRSVQPDPALINELQAEYLVEHQKSDQPKRYLWMATVNGDFLFGVPAEDFQKLNDAFDKYQERIKTDEFYRDRNDFLDKLIDRSRSIDLTQFEKTDRDERRYRENSWRFYEGGDYESLLQSPVMSFVTPVYDGAGKLIGKLFMKVDDVVNADKYLGEGRFLRNSANNDIKITAIVFLVFSGIFLWFLLPTWVYIDAQERDVKTPGVWAFLALTSLVFGMTIYLITRPNTLKTSTCPECKGELNGTRAYCPHCGYDLSNNYCQQCQYPISPEWKFCPDCRAEIRHKEPRRTEAQAGVIPEPVPTPEE
jgi:hypothetical protein